MLTTLLTYRLDVAAFVTCAVACAALAHVWLQIRDARGRDGGGGLPWQAWGLVVALIAAGGLFTEWSGRRERTRLASMLEGIAPTYAQELALLGHAKLTTDPANANDPAYLAMVDAEKRWEHANPQVTDVYTFRKDADGKVVLVVDAETDYDRDGRYEGEREERTAIGEPYDEATPALLSAFDGEATFDDELTTDRWGTTVSAYVPMRGEDGNVEAVLGVDYDASRWVAAIVHGRAAALAMVAVLFVILLAAASIVVLTRAELAARVEAEREREALQRQLLTASRRAGMAEVATGVLHNVGNVLNSVNVSAELVASTLAASKVPALAKAAAMLGDHSAAGDLPTFLEADARGRVLPEYLVKLSALLTAERQTVSDEVALLRRSVEHIKQIVAAQQAHAKLGAAELDERFDPADVIEEAVRMNAPSFERHEITVRRQPAAGPTSVTADRHKVLQILVNLIANAKRAVEEANRTGGEREILLSTERATSADGSAVVRIAVTDRGVGIAADRLPKLFAHGFTTRKDGHGFGLHSAAIAAAQMKGRLTAASEGVGRGATFTLELPATAAHGGGVPAEAPCVPAFPQEVPPACRAA